MKRDAIIEAIEKVRLDSIDIGERARLLGILHFQSALGHMGPVPMIATARQSGRLAWLIVCCFGALEAEEIRRFRQNERLLALLLVMIGYFVIVLLSVWAVISIEHVLPATSSLPTVIWSVLVLAGVGSYLFFLRMIVRPKWLGKERGKVQARNIERFHPWCIGCGYELDGLESALGDELWVGPVNCPECGMAYPAVGV